MSMVFLKIERVNKILMNYSVKFPKKSFASLSVVHGNGTPFGSLIFTDLHILREVVDNDR